MSGPRTKEDLLASGREFIEGVMRERGQCPLMVFGYKAGGGINVYPLNDAWGGPDFMRDIAVLAMKADMRKTGVVCYLTASEAWTVAIKVPTDGKAQDVEELKRLARVVGSPAASPERIEVVFLTAGDATGTISAMYLTKRKPDGSFSHLDPYDLPGEAQGGMLEGRLADLLLDKTRAN